MGTDTVKSILMKETYISADTYITRVVGNSKRDSYTLEGGDPKSINSDDEGNGFLTGHHSKQTIPKKPSANKPSYLKEIKEESQATLEREATSGRIEDDYNKLKMKEESQDDDEEEA